MDALMVLLRFAELAIIFPYNNQAEQIDGTEIFWREMFAIKYPHISIYQTNVFPSWIVHKFFEANFVKDDILDNFPLPYQARARSIDKQV
jgi:hypothetical protein